MPLPMHRLEIEIDGRYVAVRDWTTGLRHVWTRPALDKVTVTPETQREIEEYLQRCRDSDGIYGDHESNVVPIRLRRDGC